MVIRSRGLVKPKIWNEIWSQRELIQIFLSEKKVFRKCFDDIRSHNWIRGVHSRAWHDNNNGNRTTYRVLTEGSPSIGPPPLCEGGTRDSQLHSGRNWKLRNSQGHGPNWQGHFQFWLSKTSFHTSLPLSFIHHTHLLPLVTGKASTFFFFNGSLLFQ